MLLLGHDWKFRITLSRVLLMGLAALFVVLGIYRLVVGIGPATTNLNDSWTWGLWIAVDLTAVALAGAGYSMCVLSHILHIHDFHSISRRAMLFSLLSYLFFILILVLEIGRWDNALRPLISWGYDSPLFEVYIAVFAYMVIQVLEFSEVATETVFRWAGWWIKLILPVVFVIGAIIPFGHQASLGGIYLAMKGKLSELWWSQNIPWFFLITSFYVGQGIIVLDVLWSSRNGAQKADMRVLRKLSLISAVLMVVYFAWKFVDLRQTGGIALVTANTFEGQMFLLEMVGGVLVPALVALSPMGKTRFGLYVFSVLSVLGVVLSRMNVVFTGMTNTLGSGYSPSWIEWGTTLGSLGLFILVYMFIVENFHIFKTRKEKLAEDAGLTVAAH